MSMANSSATWPASRACDAPPGDDGLLATQMTATAEPLRLLVHRQNLRDTCFAADPDAQRPLAPGQVRLRNGRFALTSNNITLPSAMR